MPITASFQPLASQLSGPDEPREFGFMQQFYETLTVDQNPSINLIGPNDVVTLPLGRRLKIVKRFSVGKINLAVTTNFAVMGPGHTRLFYVTELNETGDSILLNNLPLQLQGSIYETIPNAVIGARRILANV